MVETLVGITLVLLATSVTITFVSVNLTENAKLRIRDLSYSLRLRLSKALVRFAEERINPGLTQWEIADMAINHRDQVIFSQDEEIAGLRKKLSSR